MTVVILIAIAIIGGLVWVVVSSQSTYKKNAARAEAQRMSLLSSPMHKIEDAFVHIDGTGLGIDPTNREVIIVNNGDQRVYPFEDITFASICEDSTTISQTNRSSQLTGAVVGGLISGGVGTIIGGLSASQTTSDVIKSISLKIGVNDFISPAHEITFLCHSSGFKKDLNSFTKKLYNESSANAEKWYIRLQNIINK